MYLSSGAQCCLRVASLPEEMAALADSAIIVPSLSTEADPLPEKINRSPRCLCGNPLSVSLPLIPADHKAKTNMKGLIVLRGLVSFITGEMQPEVFSDFRPHFGACCCCLKYNPSEKAIHRYSHGSACPVLCVGH